MEGPKAANTSPYHHQHNDVNSTARLRTFVLPRMSRACRSYPRRNRPPGQRFHQESRELVIAHLTTTSMTGELPEDSPIHHTGSELPFLSAVFWQCSRGHEWSTSGILPWGFPTIELSECWKPVNGKARDRIFWSPPMDGLTKYFCNLRKLLETSVGL